MYRFSERHGRYQDEKSLGRMNIPIWKKLKAGGRARPRGKGDVAVRDGRGHGVRCSMDTAGDWNGSDGRVQSLIATRGEYNDSTS